MLKERDNSPETSMDGGMQLILKFLKVMVSLCVK